MDKAACDRKACRISKSSVKSDKNLIVDLEKENNIHVYNGKEMDIENILIQRFKSPISWYLEGQGSIQFHADLIDNFDHMKKQFQQNILFQEDRKLQCNITLCNINK